jgi:alpha-amylase
MNLLKKLLRHKLSTLCMTASLAAILITAGCTKESAVNTSAGIQQKSQGVYYEIFVRSFSDSNGDGIGDLNGITAKLDYLKDLGIKGLWLTPINPSPSYHGYDVSDYYGVNSQFGTLDDFHQLTEQAHKRGIKVIIDLVLNHSSSQNPWFIDSAKGINSEHRSWYTWAEDTDLSTSGQSAVGGQAWHLLNGSNFLGIFYEGMPDLNYDNPAVRHEMVKVGQFWLQKGADGFRLDAAKHIYEDFSDSKLNPETAHKNQAWWQEFRKGLNEVNPNAYIVGEVWDSASVLAPMLDHALDSGFNFDLAKELISSADREKPGNIVSLLTRQYELYNKSSQGKFVDSPFLSNHDQTRVMSALQGNVEHAKMAASLLLTMPGNPFIYYGEEIGMKGYKPDEYLREPMIWNETGKGDGETTWEASRFNKEYTPNVASELNDPNSLLNLYKKIIQWRNTEPALMNGSIQEFAIENENVSAFVRETDKQKLLVMHNLSGKEQVVDLTKGNAAFGFTKVKLHSKEGWKLQGNNLIIPPYSTLILE